jgi:hypothetical protein
MQTTWEYSLKTEADRLLHATRQIASGFYKANGFFVLPHGTKEDIYSQPVVTLPDLPYLTIPRFWEQSSRIDVSTLPIKVPSSLLNQTQALLKSQSLPTPNFSAIQKLWNKHQDEIIAMIYSLIPNRKDSITNIHIWPTCFGTGSSFSVSKHPPETVYIYLREDHTIYTIVEAILTSITRHDVYEQLGATWSESEAIVDWLVKYSPLATLLKKISPVQRPIVGTIPNIRQKQKGSLLQKSDAFLAKIGAPIIKPKNLDPDQMTNLTPTDKALLSLLIKASPSVVTFDQISDTLQTTNPDDFSLYAITKQVQRLRDKLEQNGISGSFVQTKRGEGYLLVN